MENEKKFQAAGQDLKGKAVMTNEPLTKEKAIPQQRGFESAFHRHADGLPLELRLFQCGVEIARQTAVKAVVVTEVMAGTASSMFTAYLGDATVDEVKDRGISCLVSPEAKIKKINGVLSLIHAAL